MRIFSWMYKRALTWSAHPHAPRYLAGLAFAESSFFPVPPDVMLAPMVMSRPERAWRFAALTTAMSVLGGLVGYAIGLFVFDEVAKPIIEFYQIGERFEGVKAWFSVYGFWVVFLAGFTPIPYKVFTIAAGVVSMAIVPFVAASVIGRGARFFLVAWLLRRYGQKVANVLETRMDQIGWATVTIALIAYIVFGGRH